MALTRRDFSKRATLQQAAWTKKTRLYILSELNFGQMTKSSRKQRWLIEKYEKGNQNRMEELLATRSTFPKTCLRKQSKKTIHIFNIYSSSINYLSVCRYSKFLCAILCVEYACEAVSWCNHLQCYYSSLSPQLFLFRFGVWRSFIIKMMFVTYYVKSFLC